MKKAQYLCAFHVATGGLSGNLLGSDEQEIILLLYVIIDTYVNKIIGAKYIFVKPNSADINENNVLSDRGILEPALVEDLVKNGVPLSLALSQFDEFVRTIKVSTKLQDFHVITDGQLPVRQCLHPEACKKNIDLPQYYNQFHDLRKHFRLFYNVPTEEELNSPSDLLNYLTMTFEEDSHYYFSDANKHMTSVMNSHFTDVKKMVTIIQRLIADGHSFASPEVINLVLEPGIYSKDEEVDDNVVVRVRGLPWQSSDQDIAKFFRGLNVAKGGVALCLSSFGRRNGEAMVRFVDQEHRDMALKRQKHHMDERYIEITKSSGADFINVAGGSNNEAQVFLTRGAEEIIKMRGLPYECTAQQVIDFFRSGTENSCNVMDGEEGVLFVKRHDGKATGDAYVLFEKREDADKALTKNKELIGVRYIELFRTSTAEVQQVLNRTMEQPKVNNTMNGTINNVNAQQQQQQQQILSQQQMLPQVSLQYFPQHIITSGTRKDCIRLRGLPFEALVVHILKFLGEYASNIVFQGVHMIYNSEGLPSGEAFIQMDSEESAFLAAQQRHKQYMKFGKKQRYIEVFQCSGSDMNLVLNGGILPPPGPPISPVGKTLLPSGMLPPSQPMFSPTTQINPGLASLDPLVNAQFSQAIMQAQYAKIQQDNLMLMNHLAAQQMTTLKPSNISLNGHTPTLIPAPSPNTLMSPPLNSKQLQTMPPNIPTVSSIPQATNYLPQYPMPLNVNVNNPNFLQPTQSPLFFVNIPRISSSQQVLPKFAVPMNPTLYTMPPATTGVQNFSQNNMLSMKRAWDQAFSTSSDAGPVKRANTAGGNVASSLYASPPPTVVSTAPEHSLTFPPQYYGPI